jgi:hypothetical protein
VARKRSFGAIGLAVGRTVRLFHFRRVYRFRPAGSFPAAFLSSCPPRKDTRKLRI